MAQSDTTFTTYAAVGMREELHDQIFNISPTECPLLMAIGSISLNSRHPEWQTDALAAAVSTNRQMEGDNPTFPLPAATVRVGNYTQIAHKAFIISDTEEVVSKAGRDSEIAYQAAKKGQELKRDLEMQISGNDASLLGTGLTSVRQSASIEAWIKTNGSRDAGGADGGYSTSSGLVTAAGDSATTRVLTEDMFQLAAQEAWVQGGEPTFALVTADKKRMISKFNNSSTITLMSDADDKTLTVAVDVYRHDFGVLKIVPSRFSRSRTITLVDSRYWSMGWLRPITLKELAATGDAHKRFLRCEYALISRNEAASATIADLS